jgi:hypothetical protein
MKIRNKSPIRISFQVTPTSLEANYNYRSNNLIELGLDLDIDFVNREESDFTDQRSNTVILFKK